MPGGQIVNAEKIENLPGFPDGIPGHELGPLLMEQATRYGLEIELSEVTGLKTQGKSWTVNTYEGDIDAGAVIVAGGSTLRKLGVPGEEALVGAGRLVLRDLRRRVLPGRDRRGCGRRRFGPRRGAGAHRVRLPRSRVPQAGRVQRTEDTAGPRVDPPQGGGPLEHSRRHHPRRSAGRGRRGRRCWQRRAFASRPVRRLYLRRAGAQQLVPGRRSVSGQRGDTSPPISGCAPPCRVFLRRATSGRARRPSLPARRGTAPRPRSRPSGTIATGHWPE